MAEMNLEENWKDIEEFNGEYQVSNLGHIKTLKTNSLRARIRGNFNLIPINDGSGYLFVNLYRNGKRHKRMVHHLVWQYWSNKYIKSSHFLHIDHIDNNKQNNCIDNLQLLTARENNIKSRDKNSLGTVKQGDKWKARIYINGKYISLGYFYTQAEANQKYKKVRDTLK